MKENAEQNEAVLHFIEAQLDKGKTLTEARSIAAKHFKYGGVDPNHALRAHLDRLANPAKYKGKYAERAAKLQHPRKHKTKEAPEAADGEASIIAVATISTAVEEPVDA